MEVTVPRARIGMPDGRTREWRSALLPRFGRRMQQVDQAIVSVYLSGTNQRKIAAALRPLLTGVALSKSAVSRLAGQLQLTREAWMARRFDNDAFVYLYLDGFVVPVRRDRRVQRTPLLVVVGVRATGERVVLALHLATGETTLGWRAVLEQLVARGLAAPQLCIIDGSPGLRAAIATVWPTTALQRCVVHKLRNLLAHAPPHSQAAVTADFHRVVYGAGRAEADRAYARMLRHWSLRCAAVAQSLEEAGPELLTFYAFPAPQWKSLRSTNVIERLHGELRRRIKSQAAWSTEDGMLNLLHGLFAAGIIRLRRIDGFATIVRPQPATEAA
jgi:transposase-like protein